MRLLLSRTSATNRPDRRPSARPALRPGPFHPRQLKAVKEGGGRGAGRESRPKADLIPEGTDDLRLPTDQLLPTCPARQSTHKFLRRAFFLYLPTTAVHTPLAATAKYLDRFADLKPPRRTYAACLSAVDDAVGAIVAKLRAEKLDRNTLILFASDNGGIGGQISSNRPLRGAKFTPYEGGIRTPFTARWPDRLPAGKVYGGAVSMVDVLPTALAAATGKAPEAADGVDLVPYLTGERQGSPHETLVWWGVIGKDQPWVVRHGRWKLIGKGEEPAELYDLVEDMEEKNNRFSQNPEIAKDLVTRLKAWRQAGDEKASQRPAKK